MFGFPLGINRNQIIQGNVKDNHSPANAFPEEVEKYIQSEVTLGSLVGPFHSPPHEAFTWSPLMTRPKDNDRRVRFILW